jgi:diacylglycerol kinase (ATP)
VSILATSRAKLIVNPASGTDTAAERLPELNRHLRAALGTLDIVMTVGPGDATRLARDAAREGYEYLFVAGGDGTLNEALNGVAQVEGALAAVTFGVLPFGTGNDFATALAIPDDPKAAVEMLLAAKPVKVDIGRVNGVSFVNVSAGGFIAEVSSAVGTQLKTLTGRLAYLIGGAQVLLDYEPVRGRLTLDGTPVPASGGELALHAFAVCNSRLIGGGRLIAPDALLDDGWLDVCLIHAMPTMQFVGLLKRVADGEHVEDERVAYFRARELTLSFDREIKVNTDGQVLEARQCEYCVCPAAATFLADPASAPVANGVRRP